MEKTTKPKATKPKISRATARLHAILDLLATVDLGQFSEVRVTWEVFEMGDKQVCHPELTLRGKGKDNEV